MQISQGAEARVWATTFFSRPAIIKQRFNKKYRHPTLDAVLTTQRLKSEVRSMIKARKLGVAVPLPFYVEHTAGAIYMEHVQGQSLKQVRPRSVLGCILSQATTILEAHTTPDVTAWHGAYLWPEGGVPAAPTLASLFQRIFSNVVSRV